MDPISDPNRFSRANTSPDRVAETIAACRANKLSVQHTKKQGDIYIVRDPKADVLVFKATRQGDSYKGVFNRDYFKPPVSAGRGE